MIGRYRALRQRLARRDRVEMLGRTMERGYTVTPDPEPLADSGYGNRRWFGVG